MEQAGIESLTPAERAVLRQLRIYGRPATIAAKAGGSINTINNHLKSARRKLGVSDSAAAARLLADAEGHGQSVASHPLVMDWGTAPSQLEATAPDQGQDDAAVREQRTPFLHFAPTAEVSPQHVGQRHPLAPVNRTRALAVAFLQLAAGVLCVLAIAEALQRLFHIHP